MIISAADRRRTLPVGAALMAAALLLTGCSLGAGSSDDATDPSRGAQQQVVRVVTHDSFAIDEELMADFEAESGYTVELSAPGDGGALVNQLVLTQDAPLGDVVFGVDNTFASRAVQEDIFDPYRSPALPVSAEQYLFDDEEVLTPVDVGDVCLNIDTAWFAENDLAAPETLEDLTEEAYADLLVVTNPASSSPGLAFLAATVGEFGQEWEQYWADLADNGLLVVDSWSTAYSEEFSGSIGQGPRPIALSYSTSPAFEIDDDDQAATEAMLSTCFRQVEYAGVLAGAENTDGGQAFIDFLLSDEVQADIPEQMLMYPVNSEIDLPSEWVQWAPLAQDPIEVEPEEIDANREEWIQTWSDIVVG